MNTRKQFLINFHYLEGELREKLELSKWKDDKEATNMHLRILKMVREAQAMLREDIKDQSKPPLDFELRL